MNILDIIFPKRCVECGSIGRYICIHCQKKCIPIARNESMCPVCEKLAIGGATHPGCRSRYAIDGLTSFYRYNAAVRSAIQRIKYQFVSDLASELVSLISIQDYDFSRVRIRKHVALVPIPLYVSRFRERGFNQSEVLGKYIANSLNMSVVSHILVRTHKTAPQVDMKKRNDRLKNIKHAFSVNIDVLMRERLDACLLFDDVFTTGATMREAASVLKHAGVSFVWGVTIAR